MKMKDIKNSIKGSSANSVSRRSVARMTRFSIHEDDLGAGPSTRSPSRSPTPKKRRTVPSKPPPEPAQDEEIEAEDEVEEEEEGEEEEEEDDEDGPEEIVPENEDVTGTTDPSAKGSISVTLTDPDVLDCPICFDSLTIPVFQCENGHIACASCCTNISNKCPSCAWPIGYNRCRALEKVLESVRVPCPNTRYGCKESLIYSKLNEHEPTCIYTPCSCPLRTCNFLGFSKEVYTHFGGRHLSSAKRIFFDSPKPISLKNNQRFLYLQERTEGIIFVVNHHNDRLGSAVNIICIAPRSSKRRFPYKLIARDGDTSIKLHSLAENIPEWSPFTPLKIFLLVPSNITDSRDQLKLEVCINAS